MLSSCRKEIKLIQPLKFGGISEIVQFPDQMSEMICMILAKLPLHLEDRWNQNTLLLRRKDSREPTLIDLANFIEDDMTLVNDPLYSREAVSQFLEKGTTKQDHRGDRRKFRTTATNTDTSSED